MENEKMTKKDFELIAQIIRDCDTIDDLTVEQHRLIAIKFSQQLKVTNPSFDHAIFMKACGANK
jgi:hypothetical protein